MSTLKAVGDKIIIRPDKGEAKTESGLILSKGAVEAPKQGTVLSVGEGGFSEQTGERIAPIFQEGDRVIYVESAGKQFEFDGEELLVFTEAGIIGRLS